MGFKFLELDVTETAQLRIEPIPEAALEGTLMLKYVPRTGAWGEAEVCQVSFTPAATPDLTVEWRKPAEGGVRFIRSTWQDLPTMHHVVNALVEFPVLEARGGSISQTRGGKANLDQRILK